MNSFIQHRTDDHTAFSDHRAYCAKFCRPCTCAGDDKMWRERLRNLSSATNCVATHTLLVILQTTKYWIESIVYCPHKYGNLLPPCSITRKVHKIIQTLFHIHIKNIIHWYYKGHVTCKFWRAVYCKIISPCITINPLRHGFSIGEIIIQYSIEYNLYCLSFFLSFFFISSFFFFFFFFLHRNTYRQSIWGQMCI